MATSRSTRILSSVQSRAPWRRLFGRRSVFREVQGVGMWLPWSHRLPDYARAYPGYGQNLVELAGELAGRSGVFRMVDVGANVGDSALQVLNRVRGSVLAIEADPLYQGYLSRNVAGTQVTIAPVLLTAGDNDEIGWAAVRGGGTTHFAPVETPGDEQPPRLRVQDLPNAYPQFDSVDLVKSDTDGLDTTLIPELAAVYARSRPVLFFEYDTALTRTVSGKRAEDVWPRLASLGYADVALWTNYGEPVGIAPIDEAGDIADDARITLGRRCRYLDVAVVHADDATGREALLRLTSQPSVESGAAQ